MVEVDNDGQKPEILAIYNKHFSIFCYLYTEETPFAKVGVYITEVSKN